MQVHEFQVQSSPIRRFLARRHTQHRSNMSDPFADDQVAGDTSVSVIGTVVKFLLVLLIVPVMIAFCFVGAAYWLVFTLLGGAICHCIFQAQDEVLLAAQIKSNENPDAHVQLMKMPSTGNVLAVRWTPGGRRAYPVCIPNGLGATLVTISRLHELLVDMGFSVLSYDRAGVGFSEERSRQATSHHANAEECNDDLNDLLTACSNGDSASQWIVIGPSMGAVMAACFVAAHPERVVGYLNVDGVPAAIAYKRTRFEYASYVYSYYANLLWSGIVRVALWGFASKLAPLGSRGFSADVIRAQMNQKRFFSSLAMEMFTMIDCCDYALRAWGSAFDVTKLPKRHQKLLANTQPAACGQAMFEDMIMCSGPYTWKELPRGLDEPGGVDIAYTPCEQVDREVIDAMRAADPNAQLPRALSQIVTRCLSARKFDMARGSFFDDEMIMMYGTEHALEGLVSRGGAAAKPKRTVCPQNNHGDMFFSYIPLIANLVAEIEAELVEVGPAASLSMQATGQTAIDVRI